MLPPAARRAYIAAVLAAAALPAAVPGAGAAPEEVQVTASRIGAASLRDSSVALSSAQPGKSSNALPSDLLRGIAGAFVQQTTPGQGAAIVRGLKGSQVLHLVDGFRLNNAFYRSAPNQYMALVPTVAIARIELARGALATRYGSDAMGGVVQMLTRSPEFNTSPTAFGSLSWNSSSDALQADGGMTWGNAANAVEVAVTGADYGNRRVGGGERIASSAYRSRGLSLKSRHTLAGSNLALTLQHVEQPRTPRVDELIPGFGQDTPSSSLFEFVPNERNFIQAVWQRQTHTALADKVQLQLGWQRIRDNRRTQDYGSSTINSEQNRSDLFGFSALFHRDWRGEQRTQYGIDLTSDEVSSARQARTAGAAAVNIAPRYPDGSRIDSLGLFLTHAWTPFTPTHLEAGLRYSAFRINLPTGDAAPAIRLEPDNTSWHVGLRQRLSPTLDLLANYAQGFRAPNVFDLGTLGPRPGNRFNRPNANLQPETVTNMDFGVRWWNGRGRLEAFAFMVDFRDRITNVPTGARTDSGRDIVTSENVARSRIYGVELAGNQQLARRWQLAGALNWTRGEDQVGDGQTTPGDRIPPLNGRVSLTYAASATWSFAAEALFAGRQNRLSLRDERDVRMNPAGTPGWLTLNVSASRRLGKRLELTVGMENLLDERYREHGSGVDAPGRGVIIAVASPLPQR